MGEAIAKIGEKRFYDRKNEKYRWIWESDGYHAMSNYYYVGAIFDFYAYYRDYEEKYIFYSENLKEQLIKDEEYTKSVQAYYQRKADEIVHIEEEYNKKLETINAELEVERAEAKKNKRGDELAKSIIEVVKSSTYFDEPEFLKKIIDELRKQLAQELFERYSKEQNQEKDDLEKLKEPIKPKGDSSFFSLLQALAADIVLQSAIEKERRNSSTGVVDSLGKLKNYTFSEVALSGGEQLINDGLLNELFAATCTLITTSFEKPQRNK
jgi:hypothetical protein